MAATFRMRIQDWLADHFKFVQYSVPRKTPASNLPATDYMRLAHDLAVGFLQVMLWCVLAISAIYRMRKQPGVGIAALLLVYFLSLAAGKLFAFLI